MKFNTKVYFLGRELSNTMEGIEVANYDQLSNLTIDSELIPLINNNIIPPNFNVKSDNNDPYKINILDTKYVHTVSDIEDNKVVTTTLIQVFSFNYCELEFVYDFDDEFECECWCIWGEGNDEYYPGLNDAQVFRELISLKNNHKLTFDMVKC